MNHRELTKATWKFYYAKDASPRKNPRIRLKLVMDNEWIYPGFLQSPKNVRFYCGGDCPWGSISCIFCLCILIYLYIYIYNIHTYIHTYTCTSTHSIWWQHGKRHHWFFCLLDLKVMPGKGFGWRKNHEIGDGLASLEWGATGDFWRQQICCEPWVLARSPTKMSKPACESVDYDDRTVGVLEWRWEDSGFLYKIQEFCHKKAKYSFKIWLERSFRTKSIFIHVYAWGILPPVA